LALVAKEAIKAGKMQHKKPTKTIQITSLCEADLDQLHQLVAEYNARLLWRDAVLKYL
jgi:hypothetical protein